MSLGMAFHLTFIWLWRSSCCCFQQVWRLGGNLWHVDGRFVDMDGNGNGIQRRYYHDTHLRLEIQIIQIP
jgi:hypothetical protein